MGGEDIEKLISTMPLKALLRLFIQKLSVQVSLEVATLKTWEGGTEYSIYFLKHLAHALPCSLLLLSGKQTFFLQKGAQERGNRMA